MLTRPLEYVASLGIAPALASLRGDERGADLVEYVVLAALFAIVVGVAMSGLDETVNNNFTATTSDLTVPVSTPQ